VSGWNNSGALADIIYIYPLKKDRKTFDKDKEELGFSSKNADKSKSKGEEVKIGQLTEEQKRQLDELKNDLRN